MLVMFGSVDLHDTTGFRNRAGGPSGGHDPAWLDANEAFYRDALALAALTGLLPVKVMGDELIVAGEVNQQAAAKALIGLCGMVTELNTTAHQRSSPPMLAKGTAWLAVCPVPNRVVRPLGVLDCIGPAMEFGFRLGGKSRPGSVVVAPDLAWLVREQAGLGWEDWGLAEIPTVPAGVPILGCTAGQAELSTAVGTWLEECERAGSWMVRP